MRRLLATLIAANLLVGAVALPAAADGGVESSIVPPPGQVAVKITDVIEIDGVVPAGTPSVTATLRAVRADGAVLGAYDVSSRAAIEGTHVGGVFTLSCFYIPGCFAGDTALRATVAGYTLELVGGGGRATSERLDFDEIDPYLLSYSVLDTTHIVVRFTEDVADPEGDSALDWRIDGVQGAVRSVTGFGDERTLTLTAPLEPDDTPEVRYQPVGSPSALLPNVVYLDGAGNDLHATRRFALAADRVPPPVPTITSIDGRATTEDGQDKPVPVLGSDLTPIIEVDNVPSGSTVQLYLDDGDTRFEAEQDLLLAEVPGNGDTIRVTPSTDLADGTVHRFFARSFDRAACDPNNPSGPKCPNFSGRSRPVLYDVETTPPTLTSALASRDRIVVTLDDAVTGSSDPSDWRLAPTASPSVTGVVVDGSNITLTFDGALGGPGQLVYDPADPSALVDDHGNPLSAGVLPFDLSPLPILTGSAADLTEGHGPDGPADVTYTEQTTTFPVRLSSPSDGPSSVEFEVLGRTAEAGVDFTAIRGSVNFADQASNGTIVVESIGDRLDEPDETFVVRLFNPAGMSLPANATEYELKGRLLDDDLLPGFLVDSLIITEGETDTFTITLDAPSGRATSVDWAITAGTAALGRDVSGGSGTTTFPPGATTADISVDAFTDGIDEDPETFTLTLVDAVNATIEDGVGEGSIVDIDEEPQVLVRNVSGFEGQTVRATVGLRGASERTVTVHLVTVDDTAIGGVDYRTVSQTIEIPPGQRQAFLELDLLSDDVVEFPERFLIEPRSANNATYDSGSVGRVTISDPVAPTKEPTSGSGTGSPPGGTPATRGGGTTPLGSPDGSDDEFGVAGVHNERGGMPATGGGAMVAAMAVLGLGMGTRRRRHNA